MTLGAAAPDGGLKREVGLRHCEHVYPGQTSLAEEPWRCTERKLGDSVTGRRAVTSENVLTPVTVCVRSEYPREYSTHLRILA